MCYLVRQQQAEAERGAITPPPSVAGLRPRWIGAAAATLIAGLAVAAFVVPTSTPPLLNAKDSGAPAPIVSRTAIVPTAAVVEPGSVPVDDGVPTASDTAKAGIGHCNHGL